MQKSYTRRGKIVFLTIIENHQTGLGNMVSSGTIIIPASQGRWKWEGHSGYVPPKDFAKNSEVPFSFSEIVPLAKWKNTLEASCAPKLVMLTMQCCEHI